MLATLLLLLAVSAAAQQPIGFSHKVHIEKARMQCVDCHTGAVSQDAAVIPSIRKCMLCHQFIGTDLPEVVRLTEYWDRKHEVSWVRVYGFEQKAAVQFPPCPARPCRDRLFKVSRRCGHNDSCGRSRASHDGHLHHLPPRVQRQ